MKGNTKQILSALEVLTPSPFSILLVDKDGRSSHSQPSANRKKRKGKLSQHVVNVCKGFFPRERDLYAHGSDEHFLLAASNLVEAGRDDTSAGAAERVTERDRTAVDVGAVVWETELVDQVAKHAGKGLVDLEQVDVRHLDAGALEDFGDGISRTLDVRGR